MGEVVDKEEICSEEEYGEDITEDYLSMEIIQFRYKYIHEEGDGQEDTAYAATDCVDSRNVC